MIVLIFQIKQIERIAYPPAFILIIKSDNTLPVNMRGLQQFVMKSDAACAFAVAVLTKAVTLVRQRAHQENKAVFIYRKNKFFFLLFHVFNLQD